VTGGPVSPDPAAGSQTPVTKGASTIAEVLDELAGDGFEGSFLTRPDGRARCESCETESSGGDFASIEAERRLEGASDPDDMVVVLGLVCPACSARGTLLLGYGPNASDEDADLLVALPQADPEVAT
jgi:hypothetical protein